VPIRFGKRSAGVFDMARRAVIDIESGWIEKEATTAGVVLFDGMMS